MEKPGAAMPTHIFMEHNKVVYMLSNEGLKCKTLKKKPTFLTAPPLFVTGLVWADNLGTMYLR